MKYIVKVEVRVYESEGEMDDVLETTLRTVAPDKRSAELFGAALVDAVTEKFRAPSREAKNQERPQ